MEHQEFIEKGVYPHSKRGSIASLVIMVGFLSLIPVLAITPTANLAIELAVGVLAVSALTALARMHSFRSFQDELKTQRKHSRPPPRHWNRLLILLAGLVFVFGPFFAVGFIDPLTWLAGIGAVICGLNMGELIGTFYVRRWTKDNQLQLTRFEIWSVDQYGLGKLLESGIRAESSRAED